MAGRGRRGSSEVGPFNQKLGESDSRVVWPQASDLGCNSQANLDAIHAPEIEIPPGCHCNPCEGHGFGPHPPRRKSLGSESGPGDSTRRGLSAACKKP
jgi:hypothetical protein